MDKILDEIVNLDGTVNIESLQQDTKGNITAAELLLNGVNSVAAHHPGIKKDLDNLAVKLQNKGEMVGETENNVEKLIKENSNAKESIEKVKNLT